jgi:hypothetical protein
VFVVIRSTPGAFAVAAVCSFIVVYLAALYLGHRVAGVSLASIALAAFATAAIVAVLRTVFRRAKARQHGKTAHHGQ